MTTTDMSRKSHCLDMCAWSTASSMLEHANVTSEFSLHKFLHSVSLHLALGKAGLSFDWKDYNFAINTLQEMAFLMAKSISCSC